MRNINFSYRLNLLAIVLISSIMQAQVGINTTDPKGVIDFNSNTLGVVYPNVALTGTDDEVNVVNPQGGDLAIGTVVYNTNTTDTGNITDVNPGIYVWNGSSWNIHFKKRQSQLYNQDGVLRTEANFASQFQDVPGLGVADNKTFTARYNGLYRVEVRANYGAGRTETNNSLFVSLATGEFKFSFDTDDYTFKTSAFSAYTDFIDSGTYYEDVSKQTEFIKYIRLIKGETYPISLSFDAFDAPGFIGNGSSISAMPASTNVLIDEDFEGAYVVQQIHTPDAGCFTDGWEVLNTGNRCTNCDDNVLYISAQNSTCTQNAITYLNFVPTTNSVNIQFDYGFREQFGRNDSFRVYIYSVASGGQVGPNLVSINNSGSVTTNDSYNGNFSVTPNSSYFVVYEYINANNQARYASVDNVIITEATPAIPANDTGRGYVGNEVKSQVEFTYIGE